MVDDGEAGVSHHRSLLLIVRENARRPEEVVNEVLVGAAGAERRRKFVCWA